MFRIMVYADELFQRFDNFDKLYVKWVKPPAGMLRIIASLFIRTKDKKLQGLI
ncbi:MAG: hypothetical protein JW995_10165 [Melioribacteraceae bacterium]|nr:hypothetical protein [Melioribacteraceae bacterium]